MKAILRKQFIFENLPSEENLLELSRMESLYAIRKLKALTHSLIYGSIDVNDDANSQGQHYSEEFEIWFNKNEMILCGKDTD